MGVANTVGISGDVEGGGGIRGLLGLQVLLGEMCRILSTLLPLLLLLYQGSRFPLLKSALDETPSPAYLAPLDFSRNQPASGAPHKETSAGRLRAPANPLLSPKGNPSRSFVAWARLLTVYQQTGTTSTVSSEMTSTVVCTEPSISLLGWRSPLTFSFYPCGRAGTSSRSKRGHRFGIERGQMYLGLDQTLASAHSQQNPGYLKSTPSHTIILHAHQTS